MIAFATIEPQVSSRLRSRLSDSVRLERMRDELRAITAAHGHEITVAANAVACAIRDLERALGGSLA